MARTKRCPATDAPCRRSCVERCSYHQVTNATRALNVIGEGSTGKPVPQTSEVALFPPRVPDAIERIAKAMCMQMEGALEVDHGERGKHVKWTGYLEAAAAAWTEAKKIIAEL